MTSSLISVLLWYQKLSPVWRVLLVVIPVVLILLGVIWYMSSRAVGSTQQEAAKALVAAVTKGAAESEKLQEELKAEIDEIDAKIEGEREEYDASVDEWKSDHERIDTADSPDDVDRVIYGDRPVRTRPRD